MISKLTRLTDEELAELAFYAGESTSHSDPNYLLSFESLATGSSVLSIVIELQERRKADSEPVATLDVQSGRPDGHKFSLAYSSVAHKLPDDVYFLYRHAQQPVVPATLPCSVELKPGLIIGKGCKTETLLTALRHRADYNADIDAMTPEERAEHDASIEAFKAMLPQPAPVVPEMTAIVERLNDSGYEYEGGEVTPQNAATVVDILLQQLDDAVQGRNAQQPLVPEDVLYALQKVARIRLDLNGFDGDRRGIADCLVDAEEALIEVVNRRAAMLQADNSQVIPEGYVLVPMRLTAENGAKGALSGEFSETKFINCPECFGDDECETCDGSGRIEIKVPVSWTTIKEIWIKGVEHFAAAPLENN